MVTVVLVAVFAASVGTFFVKLLILQEQDRDAAYIREELADICGAYADVLAVGKSFSTNEHEVIVKYVRETGGVSFETGCVTRVANLIWAVTNKTLVLNVDLCDVGALKRKVLSRMDGDSRLIAMSNDILDSLRLSCTLTPLASLPVTERSDPEFANFVNVDVALGYLSVCARYAVREEERPRVVSVGRVVRLWNHD